MMASTKTHPVTQLGSSVAFGYQPTFSQTVDLIVSSAMDITV